jgi:hypothetical protein
MVASRPRALTNLHISLIADIPIHGATIELMGTSVPHQGRAGDPGDMEIDSDRGDGLASRASTYRLSSR